MAQEHDVDITKLEGSGIHGRVTKADLEAFLAEREQAPAAGSALPAATAPSAVEPELVPAVRRETPGFSVAPYTDSERVEIEPMSKIRQITAAHMAYSKATSAHVTTVFHLDLSRVARIRKQAKNAFLHAHGTKLTYMPFIFKAVANALKANPKLNSSVDGTNIVYKKDVNIGMAVALDWGLIVPVLKRADELNLVGLARTANDLADRARNKKLRPEEVQGGTFTVTNPGVFGTLFGTPIINQPQVAILGLGVIEKRPVVDTDENGNDIIAIKTMSYFAITYDHRIVDGADADHFMNDVKHTLEQESWSELDAFL
jgi:2-oxoglutarate dehydrogenase E2 component (dihydrolipoamide succinyltransferase)